MPVGFANFTPNIKIQRRPKNPMDKCTIVSIFQQDIIDEKFTVFPSIHKILAAPDNDFSILVVESVSYFREMEGGLFLEIPVSSIDVARAFINDYVSGLPDYVPNAAAPGLFFCLGSHTKDTVKKYVDENGQTFAELLNAAKARQKTWYLRSIESADKDWARTSGNPRSVGNIARLAAEKLAIQNKPWMQDFVSMQKEACPACGQFIVPAYPVCPNCKVIINKEKAKELGLTFAS